MYLLALVLSALDILELVVFSLIWDTGGGAADADEAGNSVGVAVVVLVKLELWDDFEGSCDWSEEDGEVESCGAERALPDALTFPSLLGLRPDINANSCNMVKIVRK